MIIVELFPELAPEISTVLHFAFQFPGKRIREAESFSPSRGNFLPKKGCHRLFTRFPSSLWKLHQNSEILGFSSFSLSVSHRERERESQRGVEKSVSANSVQGSDRSIRLPSIPLTACSCIPAVAAVNLPGLSPLFAFRKLAL